MPSKSRPAKSHRGPRGMQGAAGKTGARGPRGPRGKAGTATITRDEFDAAVGSITANLRELEVQFRRIAQIQAQLDELKQAVARLSTLR